MSEPIAQVHRLKGSWRQAKMVAESMKERSDGVPDLGEA